MTEEEGPVPATEHPDLVRQIVESVLYEGYLLWPYRRSALKNQHRWTLGGIYPAWFSAVSGSADPSWRQTECLLETTAGATVDVEVRFLHLVHRQVRQRLGGRWEPVPELTVAGTRHLTWSEATEREVLAMDLPVPALRRRPHVIEAEIPAGSDTEWLIGHCGRREGALERRWQPVRVRLEVAAEPVRDGSPPVAQDRRPAGEELMRLRVRVSNAAGDGDGGGEAGGEQETGADRNSPGPDRDRALARTLLSAHTVLHADHGEFVSALDPPESLREAARSCRNVGTWPVLVGQEGTRRTVLSSPIVLYDYPRVAPESPGDLFDATEIDQLLALNIRSLTETELREARDTDPRARELIDRCVSLTEQQLSQLHGTMRDVRRLA